MDPKAKSINRLEEPSRSHLVAPDTDQIDNPSQSPESVLVGSLVAELLALGFQFKLVGNRLRVSPWPALTDEQKAACRMYRSEIKELVRAGLPEVPLAPKSEATVTVSAPKTEKPEPRAALPEEIRRIVEWNDPAEVQRRDDDATREMFSTLGLMSPYL